ncbi:WXG100 family type VII secretion target [Streptomyces sp. NPDC057621]|uniref:WXG100 family type VII secretion target n=1 Tax=Streptomyces liliiviolaceus TaxID=2823109 RepID=A0A940XV41_9ACTN|nr:WXG100 family type VII secretion target [Streptomyces liliiviolaceus]MBQ0848377.1 WXG100 family type VII secretion target [Streptomyces liliiviolaceus]
MAGKRPAFPHIGWDPTPGDVDDTRDLAKKLGGLASDLSTTLRELERIEAGAWKGKTAVAFTEYVGQDVTPLISKSHDSFDKASRALHRWANELQDFQDEANRLEKSAGEKLEARETAQQKADAKGDGKGSEDLGKASGAVDEVTGKVHDLEDRYKRAAGAISKELDKAGDIAPDEPGFWDKLTKGVADAWDATGQWVKDHADMIKLIGDLLSDLSAVLGLLAIITLPFPPLAAIFGTAALIASGLALAAHGLAKWGGADVSWMQMGLDAVGMMPGIGMFSKGIKVVGGSKAVEVAGALGKGFQYTEIGSSRILMAFGKNSRGLEHGLGKAGLIKIGGKSGDVWKVEHATSGLKSRMGGLAAAGYHEGQWLGSKGLNLLPGVAINPLGAGIAIDAGAKILPKVTSIHQHVGEALFPGDQFEKSASGG